MTALRLRPWWLNALSASHFVRLKSALMEISSGKQTMLQNQQGGPAGQGMQSGYCSDV